MVKVCFSVALIKIVDFSVHIVNDVLQMLPVLLKHDQVAGAATHGLKDKRHVGHSILVPPIAQIIALSKSTYNCAHRTIIL